MKSSATTIRRRHTMLLNYLNHKQRATVEELAKYLNTSTSTIRRDLTKLEDRQQLTRYFGGADAAKDSLITDESVYIASISENLEYKRAIARKAAALLDDGDIVFINSSSTAMLIYPYIEKNVIIITNNGRALTLKRPTGVGLMLTGGEVQGCKQSLTGQAALDMLSRITATKCILGVSGISVKGGITSLVMQETAINRKMLERCSGEKIIVADHTKIGLEYNFFSGSLDQVTCLVTDTSADEERLQELRHAGIRIITAEPEKEDPEKDKEV